ncbi:hypothetical protein ACHAXS_010218 [Conticribra weissflogii]
MISTVELIDRFQVLLNQENTSYRITDYLSPSHQLQTAQLHGDFFQTQQDAAILSKQKSHWRSKLCAWMYCIVDTHDLSRELVSIALSYMDRYLSKVWMNYSDDFQLVGMTSLYIAIKLYRHHGKCAGICSFAKLSKGIFNEQDFLTMEDNVLNTLEWRMHPPTAVSYLELLIYFVPRGATHPFTRKDLFERVKFLLELSSTVHYFFAKKPSCIAIAAFIEVMGHDEGPRVSDGKYRDHFHRCVSSIAGVECDSVEVMKCCEAMAVVHANAWRDMREEMLVCVGGRATATTKDPVTVVSP